MNYEQRYQEIEQKLKGLQKDDDETCYISDGIVRMEQWLKQDIRPLFIGKEAYDLEGRDKWDYTDWLKKSPQEAFRASSRTWQTTAYVSYSLQHGLLAYESLPSIKEDKDVAESLEAIAFINVGKYGAEKTTSWGRLNDLYSRNKTFLHDQIELFQPNIIIGWSTLEFFQTDASFITRFGSIEKKTNQDAVDSWVSKGILFIDAYHPVYFKVSQCRYVNSIVEAVKKHFGAINKELPVL